MKGATALSTFGVTAIVLGIVVGLGLRGGAQNVDANSALMPPAEVNLPVVGITKNDRARLHIVNLSMNTNELSHRFMFMFLDARGMLIRPEQVCEVRVGETCSAALTTNDCMVSGPLERCEFRTMVVPDPLACIPRDNTADGGVSDFGELRWSTNLEVVAQTGSTRFSVGPIKVHRVPVPICPGGNADAGNPFPTDGGGGSSDAGVPLDGGGHVGDAGFFPDGGSNFPDAGFVPDGGSLFGGLNH